MMALNDDLKSALADYVVALGDDEMILGQRLSEWCGHAPILEEDIAFANLALDEIGHANLWYALAAELRGQDAAAYPDQLVYHRPASAYRCCQLVELPNGDWAFSILRQCLFDLHEQVQLESLSASAYAPLETLWPYTAQLNQPMPDEAMLSAAGIVPPAETRQPGWEAVVLPLLEECVLAIPTAPPLALVQTEHTPGFTTLLADLQYLTRLYPDAAW